MCGICGYIGPKEINENQLWEMNNTMYHRGPDDGGVWKYSRNGMKIGMAQRRLSIFDLSELGHQPMVSNDGQYVVVYNGEIYNFKEIRKKLEEKKYVFKSNCDTEVILYAYKEWGKDCVSHFNGMFAIALYDKNQDKLVLVRDRIGKKLLYYYMDGMHFVFASELKAIVKYPYFNKKLNYDVIANYMCNKYLPAPLCIFENTYKMLPGTILEYSNGQISITSYWDIVDEYNMRRLCKERNYKICKSFMNKLIKEAVASRLNADVSVGAFLSGGIDSTLVTAIAQKSLGIPINTYSIGFYDKKRNEAPYSKEIAKYLGTVHHEYYVTEQDILALIKDLPFYYDEPFADSSQLPTMLVSEYASQDIKVALSGDGGDEIFCGYNIYDLVWIAQHADILGEIANKMPGIEFLKKGSPAELRAFLNNRGKDTKTQLFTDVIAEEVDKLLSSQTNSFKHIQERRLKISNWQERRMLLDMQTYLPDEILVKTDRASMKYSLEVRCPLLDYKIIEESFRIPHKYKYRHFEKKYILKEILYDYVPKKLLDRPKKGFGVPLVKWLRMELGKEIKRYADKDKLRKQEIFDPVAVEDLIIKQKYSNKIIYSSILWSFYVFQRWYESYVENLW